MSTYGWRVDIERIRSKYFVDMMRPKGGDDKSPEGDSAKKLPKVTATLSYSYQPGDPDPNLTSLKNHKILEQIQRIKNESGKVVKNQEGRSSAMSNPPLPKPSEQPSPALKGG